MKKFILTGLVVAGLMIFAACGGNDEVQEDAQYENADSNLTAEGDEHTTALPDLLSIYNEIIGVTMLIPSAWQENQLDVSSFSYMYEVEEDSFWSQPTLRIEAFYIDNPLTSIQITQELELAAHDFLEVEINGRTAYTWMGVEEIGFGFFDAIITIVFQEGNQLTLFEFLTSLDFAQETIPLFDAMIESIEFSN